MNDDTRRKGLPGVMWRRFADNDLEKLRAERVEAKREWQSAVEREAGNFEEVKALRAQLAEAVAMAERYEQEAYDARREALARPDTKRIARADVMTTEAIRLADTLKVQLAEANARAEEAERERDEQVYWKADARRAVERTEAERDAERKRADEAVALLRGCVPHLPFSATTRSVEDFLAAQVKP